MGTLGMLIVWVVSLRHGDQQVQAEQEGCDYLAWSS